MKKTVIHALFSSIIFLIISCEINPPELSGVEGILVDSLGNPAPNIEINARIFDTKFLSGKLITESKILTDKNGAFSYSYDLKNAEISFDLNIFPNPIYPYVYKLPGSNSFGTYGTQKPLVIRKGEYFKNVTLRYLSRTEIEAYYDSLSKKTATTIETVNPLLKN